MRPLARYVAQTIQLTCATSSSPQRQRSTQPARCIAPLQVLGADLSHRALNERHGLAAGRRRSLGCARQRRQARNEFAVRNTIAAALRKGRQQRIGFVRRYLGAGQP